MSEQNDGVPPWLTGILMAVTGVVSVWLKEKFKHLTAKSKDTTTKEVEVAKSESTTKVELHKIIAEEDRAVLDKYSQVVDAYLGSLKLRVDVLEKEKDEWRTHYEECTGAHEKCERRLGIVEAEQEAAKEGARHRENMIVLLQKKVSDMAAELQKRMDELERRSGSLT